MMMLLVALSLQATPADKIAVKDGFKVELLHSVPKAQQGSWVSLCVDPKGRLIVSDQDKLGLWRVEVKEGGVDVQKIDVPLSGAQGLVWAWPTTKAAKRPTRTTKPSSRPATLQALTPHSSSPMRWR